MQGAFSGSRWYAFRVFLALAMPSAGFACAKVSAALCVHTLFGSPAEGDGDGWVVQVSTADVALFLPAYLHLLAYYFLPVTGCLKFLRVRDRGVCMLKWGKWDGVFFI